MPEEIIEDQPIKGGTKISDDLDIKVVIEENKKINDELDKQRKIASGQDQKNTELFKEIAQLKKVISEKEETKKSVEEQIEELNGQLKERDLREAIANKKASVSKIIAEHKLDPEFDFDYLYKFETTELMEEKAKERAENYKTLKEEGFRERAGGTPPRKGEAHRDDLSKLTLGELNSLGLEKPELIPQILEAMKNKKG